MHVAKDWDAVAAAIRSRLNELDMTQAELAARAGVALMTVRELQHNSQPRRRSPRTLTAVSEALGWPGDQLARILEGERLPDVDADDPVLAELDAVKADLVAVVRRLDAIERRLGIADAQS
ncbi:helix-turn-helix domain-containing protein [Pseudonocardia sp. CA-142604]|uniref:helix-turn-helix domain-containing protein n=1 Tax=Pseudonocardia sp. CA-142604 TaxID=3240024 RepID=UPI003D9355AD